MLPDAFGSAPGQAGSDVCRVFVDSGKDSRSVETTGRERESGKGLLDDAGLTVILLRTGMQGQGEVVGHVFGDQRLPCGLDGVQLFNIRSKNASLPAGVPVLDFTQELPDLTGEPAVVVGNIPEDLEQLRQIFQEHDFQAVYFKNEIAKAYYLTGYGSRDQYAKLYKTIYQYPEFDVRYKLKDLAAYLKIQQILLVKMIQIFQELGFVTIENGIMKVNKEAEKREIAESSIYQKLKQTVKEQELMALGTVREIYDYLTGQGPLLKQKQTSKHRFCWLHPILLFALYWLGIYLSLKNPMEEINYSENGGLIRYVMFKPFTESIGSDRIWKEDEGF